MKDESDAITSLKNKIKVGILGVSGYTGAALTQLLSRHPQVEIKALCSSQHEGKHLGEIYPYFLGYADLPFLSHPERLSFNDLDCLFTATPNGIASDFAPLALKHNVKVIDLAADFRLKNSTEFNHWYSPLKAASESLLKQAVYGLTELNRAEIKKANLLANPGCYPTASSLPIIPLLQSGLADSSLCIIDAKSGTTGAGKKAEESILFSEVNESFSAYKIEGHRHTPEIEQNLQIFGGQKLVVRFTPHLLPIKRGILSTIYLRPKSKVTKSALYECLQNTYQNEKFVNIVNEPPKTKDVYGSNRCHIFATYDERSDLIILVSVIDNLMKGAAGQAIQNFNLMFGLKEHEALEGLGSLP